MRRLTDLADGGYEQNVRAVLRDVWVDKAPEEVRIRPEFVRRDAPWSGAASDSRLPPVTERPPAARLLSPRGLALRLYLTGLFVAACTTRKGAPFDNTYPLRSERLGPPGWADMVAAPTRQSPAAANRQATPLDNRIRQLKSALDTLASDEVRLAAIGAGRGKYERFRLNDEGGSEGLPNDRPYTVPRSADAALEVPAGFFLNGWHHALTGSEILAYLALHDLRRLDPAGHDAAGGRLTGGARIRHYGLSKDTYEGFAALCAYGLAEAEADPNRREDGTFEGFNTGSRPMPNRYRLMDEGTRRPAVETVAAVIARQ